MKAARRNEIATLLLPGLLIAAVYMAALRPSLVRRVDALQSDVQTREARLPEAAAVDRQETELDELRARVAAAAPHDGSASTSITPEERAELRLAVARVFTEHGLVLLEEKASEMDLPVVVAARLGRDPKSPRSRVPVTTLVFVGAYLDVLAALKELRDATRAALPLQLKMEPSPDGFLVPQWTLVLA